MRTRIVRSPLVLLALVAALAGLRAPARAADPAISSMIIPSTLERIRASGTVVLGYRISAMPFSYQLPDGQAAGYAVDLCRDLTADIAAALGGMPLRIAYRPVTTEDRIAQVVSGRIDLECGTTTQNPERLQQVAFSPVFFIAGTRLLVSRQSTIRSYRDLSGRTVVVTAGTTNEGAMRTLADRLLLRMRIVSTPDHSQSFRLLRDGRADAFATDDVLLAGLAAMPEGTGFVVVGGYLSYEPYGLMYRRDDAAFGTVIEAGFRRLAASRRLDALYTRWLTERLPTGETLNIPMSTELTHVFRQLGQPD